MSGPPHWRAMTPYRTFQIQIDGRTYSGSWHVDIGMLHVSSAYGSASDAAGPHPEKTAERILREIVSEVKSLSPR